MVKRKIGFNLHFMYSQDSEVTWSVVHLQFNCKVQNDLCSMSHYSFFYHGSFALFHLLCQNLFAAHHMLLEEKVMLVIHFFPTHFFMI